MINNRVGNETIFFTRNISYNLQNSRFVKYFIIKILCLSLFDSLTCLSQAEGPLMTGENLNNPTKTRAKGPSGRKLPSRKTKTEEEEEEEDTESDLLQTKPKLSTEKTIDSLGKMNAEEFDRVWFIKVPSLSSLLSLQSSKESIKSSEEEDPDNNNLLNNNSKFDTENFENCPEEEDKDSESESSEESDNVQLKSKKRWKNCVIL